MSSTEHLVRVALPRSGDQLYTYRVPDELAPPEPGSRVLVPFGRNRRVGWVVEKGSHDDLRDVQVRDLTLVLDASSGLSGPLLELARFVSDYYLCPLGDVLKSMQPGGPRETVHVLLEDEGREVDPAGLPKGQAAVLEVLHAAPRQSLEGLRRRLGRRDLMSSLRALQVSGWLRLDESLQESTRAKTRLAFVATDGDAEPGGRSPLRASLLGLLREEPRRPWTVAELATHARKSEGSVRPAVQALEKLGLCERTEREERRRPGILAPGEDQAGPKLELSSEQADAVAQAEALIAADDFGVLLIEGVTGAGKTEVYLRAIETTLRAGRRALYLVPEIAITPLLLRRLRARFGERTAILHSGLSPGERRDERERLLQGEVDLVVGARSAVFAPVPELGLIVVDEEHESSYKQDSQPRYHGRDIAIMRGRFESAPVLLGSATPSLESYRHALEGRYGLARMTSRPAGSQTATVEIVDLRAELREDPLKGPISKRLREAMDETLAAGRQVMILLNRRGWADFCICRECGEVEQCEHCAVSLTVHLRSGMLRCHYCDAHRSIPEKCRSCAGEFIQHVGEGTEQLEAALKAQLPDVVIARLDRDVARRRGAAEKVLAEFEAGRSQVLLGTQMIAKGHDFAGVTLVGVLQADRSLWLPDFRAAERTFQLLTQVAGRAGRRQEPGRVVVQSLTPDHPALKLAAAQDYGPFYEAEALGRERLGYPPFAHLVALLVSSEIPEKASDHARELASRLRHRVLEHARVLGPAPAPLPKLRDRHRFQVLVKTSRRLALQAHLREVMGELRLPTGVQVDVDVDPQSLL
ncbi:MAG: primosomal protein N' [Acidobacteriota bacterium]